MSLTPRVTCEGGAYRLCGIRPYGVDYSELVVEGAAQHDEAVINEGIHVGRVRGPFGLLFKGQ